MYSIGVDIVKNDRFTSYINDYRKISKILSKKEIEVFSLIINENRKIEYIASRFCCKEALYKAGIKEQFNNISVLNDDDNKPYVECNSSKKIEITISHEKEYSVAFAMVF